MKIKPNESVPMYVVNYWTEMIIKEMLHFIPKFIHKDIINHIKRKMELPIPRKK